jgi:predicted alpha-1,2-mannosidase
LGAFFLYGVSLRAGLSVPSPRPALGFGIAPASFPLQSLTRMPDKIAIFGKLLFEMKFKFFLVFLLGTALVSAQHQFVNPMIGTGGHGHTYPGATVPFGMVQLSPDTRVDGSWDGCSGYHYSDNVIYGFSHTHLNGTGISDFGDIMLMPTIGEPSLDKTVYSSGFSHANEKASAGFYSVKLEDDNIDVALTTSTRVGFHKYTFNKSGQANIILDLNHRDKLLSGEIRIIDDKTIEVLRRSEAWARDQYVFARIEFSKPMKLTNISNNAFAPANITDRFFAGTVLAVSFSKNVIASEEIMVKVALSPTGYEGASRNMSEIKGWDFKKVLRNAQKLWDNELARIEIKTDVPEKKNIFYTALYHTMVQPNIAQDIDGQYRGRDNKIHDASGFDYYSVFSLWDTFRGAHPLYTLIQQKRTTDFINTFLAQYEQGGRLPVWELASNETGCMIGYHSVSVIADAMVKGIKGFDYGKAFEAAKQSAMLDHLGLDAYKKNGFISIGDEHESVSKTVEYAYDDWCIAQMARVLDKDADYRYFMQRSQSWKNIFDSNSGFMRPKKNGGWETPFDPREVNNNFTEGNSWQYSFFVPHDIPGMIEAYGGPKNFEAKLDEMFSAPSATTGREQVDITGLIGQYAHGNEPSHHMAYLYNYIGKREKTSEKIHFILDNFYKNSPDGLIGNEDCGQMSAWYVLSALGIYTVTPGSGLWATTIPYFEEAKIHLENGEVTQITSESQPAELGYLASDQSQRTAETQYEKIVVVPVIESKSKSFRDKTTLSLSAAANSEIYYAVQTDSKVSAFKKYDGPFEITNSCTVVTYAEINGKQSNHVTGSFFKKPTDYTVNISSVYNSQYHAGGPEGLIDGIYGSENWRKGDWQGYQGQDFDCVVDLKKSSKISELSADFLQDSRSWILMPSKVEFYVSEDNKNFTLAAAIDNTLDPKLTDTKIINFKSRIDPVTARYVRIKAQNFGVLPEWHQGHGGEAFIFIDEIQIR